MNSKTIICIFIFIMLMPAGIPNLNAQTTARFVDNGDNTITDTMSGLMWRKRTPTTIIYPAVTWHEAVEQCEELNIGGYNDWRLPTIEEWATIIDTENQFPALAEPNPFENVIVSSPYWTLTEYTYGPDYTCDASGCPLQTYVVLLYLGYMGHQNKNEHAFLWPVRSTIPVAVVPRTPVVEEPSVVELLEEETKITEPSDKGLLFVQQGLLSNEFELQGIEKQEQVRVGFYTRMPIKKGSKAVLKPKNAGIEIAIYIYEIDQTRVNLFNNNAIAFELPIRMRIDPETGGLIFYEQP